MIKEDLPAGYVYKDRACAVCGMPTKNVFQINGYLVKACTHSHADRRINNIYSLLKFVK